MPIGLPQHHFATREELLLRAFQHSSMELLDVRASRDGDLAPVDLAPVDNAAALALGLPLER